VPLAQSAGVSTSRRSGPRLRPVSRHENAPSPHRHDHARRRRRLGRLRAPVGDARLRRSGDAAPRDPLPRDGVGYPPLRAAHRGRGRRAGPPGARRRRRARARRSPGGRLHRVPRRGTGPRCRGGERRSGIPGCGDPAGSGAPRHAAGRGATGGGRRSGPADHPGAPDGSGRPATPPLGGPNAPATADTASASAPAPTTGDRLPAALLGNDDASTAADEDSAEPVGGVAAGDGSSAADGIGAAPYVLGGMSLAAAVGGALAARRGSRAGD
jgi:hypothetical protein